MIRTDSGRRTAEAAEGRGTAPALAMIVAGMVLASGPAGCGGMQKREDTLPKKQAPAKAEKAKPPQSQPVAKGWNPQAMLKQTWEEQSSLEGLRIELLKLRGSKALLALDQIRKMMQIQRNAYDISPLESLDRLASEAAEKIRKQLPERIAIWKFAEPLEKDVQELEGTCEGMMQGFMRIKEGRVKAAERDLEKAQQRLRRRRSRRNMLEVSRLNLILSSVQAGALESDGQRQARNNLDSDIAEAQKGLDERDKELRSLRERVQQTIDSLNSDWILRLKALAKSRGIME